MGGNKHAKRPIRASRRHKHSVHTGFFGKVASLTLAKALGQDAIQILESDSQRTRVQRYRGSAKKRMQEEDRKKTALQKEVGALFTKRCQGWRRGKYKM